MSQTRNSIEDIWGARTPYTGNWPARVDEHTTEHPDQWIQSACVLCSNGCGIDIGVKDGRIVGVRGREVDRVNHGRLGPKGLHGWMANNTKDRLTTPYIRQHGELIPATWDAAMNLIVSNKRYAEMFNLPPDVVRPGVSIRDIIAHSLAIGNYRQTEGTQR